MCEFCNNPFSINNDSNHTAFAGFFSADAIEAAVRQANAARQQADDDEASNDDTDGT